MQTKQRYKRKRSKETLSFCYNMMEDLERQIVSNVANDHQKRLLKSTVCKMSKKQNKITEDANETKIQKEKVEGKAAAE